MGCALSLRLFAEPIPCESSRPMIYGRDYGGKDTASSQEPVALDAIANRFKRSAYTCFKQALPIIRLSYRIR